MGSVLPAPGWFLYSRRPDGFCTPGARTGSVLPAPGRVLYSRRPDGFSRSTCCVSCRFRTPFSHPFGQTRLASQGSDSCPRWMLAVQKRRRKPRKAGSGRTRPGAFFAVFRWAPESTTKASQGWIRENPPGRLFAVFRWAPESTTEASQGWKPGEPDRAPFCGFPVGAGVQHRRPRTRRNRPW